MKFKKWNIGSPAEQDVALLRTAGYPYLLSTVLAARGITTPEAAAEFLERERQLTISPMLMRDMDKAVERIQRAIADGETIAVFGDYDVDGITSTVLLRDYLKSCGVRCLRHIPRRIEDGYGLSKDAIASLREQGATLMITVDCGITGNEEVAFANSIGLDVVVTDHHECKETLPDPPAGLPVSLQASGGRGRGAEAGAGPGRRKPGGRPLCPVLHPGRHRHHR